MTEKRISKLIKELVALDPNGIKLAELNRDLGKANIVVIYKSAQYDYGDPLNSTSHNKGVCSNDK